MCALLLTQHFHTIFPFVFRFSFFIFIFIQHVYVFSLNPTDVHLNEKLQQTMSTRKIHSVCMCVVPFFFYHLNCCLCEENCAKGFSWHEHKKHFRIHWITSLEIAKNVIFACQQNKNQAGRFMNSVRSFRQTFLFHLTRSHRMKKKRNCTSRDHFLKMGKCDI